MLQQILKSMQPYWLKNYRQYMIQPGMNKLLSFI